VPLLEDVSLNRHPVTLADAERDNPRALERSGWHIKGPRAAAALGSSGHLYSRMKKLGIAFDARTGAGTRRTTRLVPPLAGIARGHRTAGATRDDISTRTSCRPRHACLAPCGAPPYVICSEPLGPEVRRASGRHGNRYSRSA